MKTALCLLAFLSLFLSQTMGDDLVLVDSGEARTKVYLRPDAPPFTRAAAMEFIEYLEKATDARFELIRVAPFTLPEKGIWLGFQPMVKEAFPKLDLELQHPEEILLAANENHLVIAGRDRWDPDNLVVQGIDEKIEGRQQEYGTVNAIYSFLQDHLGIRWFWPGELGEDVPKARRLAIQPFTHRYHPTILGRGGIFNYSQLSNKGYGKSQLWTRRQRLQLCSMEIGGGHGFGEWWEKYHQTEPDIFALQPDGTRSGHPSPRNAKLCQSNPRIVQLWLKDVAHQLEEDPNQSVFNASPNDGWSSGHCVCENCRAWDHPDGEPRLMHWHHYREERPALSDRHVTFANRLAEALEQRYPGKGYQVMMLSYGHSRPRPIAARSAENVIMVSVANFLGRTGLVDRGSTWGTTHRDQFRAWGEVSHHVMWRPNTGSPAGWQQGLPDLSVQQTIKDFQFIAEHHCRGIYIDAVWEHWANLGPQYYMMAQLGWDPKCDAEAVLKDYYQRAFGKAADDIRNYYETFEKARMKWVQKKEYQTSLLEFPELYDDKLLEKAQKHLKEASKVIAGDSSNNSPFAKRVAFVQAGFEWTRKLTQVIDHMSGYWANPDPGTANRVRTLWKEMEQIPIDHPYSINWGPLRPTTPRMLGLHPDHPNPKWKIKKDKKAPNDLDQN